MEEIETNNQSVNIIQIKTGSGARAKADARAYHPRQNKNPKVTKLAVNVFTEALVPNFSKR